MRHTREAITQTLAERRGGAVARRDDTRIARRLSRQPVVEGVSRLDDGAGLDDVGPGLPASGVMALLEEAHGAASQRAMGPFVPSVLRSGVQTVLGMERINARPNWWFRAEALMPLLGFQAPQVRQGIGQRGATTRQGERRPGPPGQE